MKTIEGVYCATGAFLSYACLCTLAGAKFYPLWRAVGCKLLQCVLQTKSLRQHELAQSVAHVHQFLARRMYSFICSNKGTESHRNSKQKSETLLFQSISNVGWLVFWGPALTKLAPSSFSASLMPHALSCPIWRFCLVPLWNQLWRNTCALAPRFLAVIWSPGRRVGNQIYLIHRDTMRVGWWLGDWATKSVKHQKRDHDDELWWSPGPPGRKAIDTNPKVQPKKLSTHGQTVNFKYSCRISRGTLVSNTLRYVWLHFYPTPQDNSVVVPRCRWMKVKMGCTVSCSMLYRLVGS